MKIVLDTSVVLAAFFFGGPSRQIIESVARGKTAAYVTQEIVAEYEAAVARMASKKRAACARISCCRSPRACT